MQEDAGGLLGECALDAANVESRREGEYVAPGATGRVHQQNLLSFDSKWQRQSPTVNKNFRLKAHVGYGL